MSTQTDIDKLINNRFAVGPMIGKGSFGKIHEAKDTITGKKLAIKFMKREKLHLKNEYEVSKYFLVFFFFR